MTTPPTGTVTFLFTDIEGSTRLWEEQPDEMRAALAEHDTIVRGAAEAHGGHVFATGGDGFAIAFSRAADAVDAALKAQAALAQHRLIRVRMGVHTGEVQERDGDYFGPAVNRAARLMAIGHGGQVLVSAATEALLDPAVPRRDLGEHRLRDLSAPQRVFQLGERSFPALRSVDVVPSNLPTVATELVGRGDDIIELSRLAVAERTLTLTGTGGVGKTRLSLAVAAAVAAEFFDGVWLVDLAPVADAAGVSQAVGSALGVSATIGVDEASVVTYLRGRRLVLVLDNCEHVLDAVADLVTALIGAAPDVHMVTTSREPLGVDGEVVRRVRSLAVPDADDDPATVDSAHAVRLFVERASAASGDFHLNATNRGAVVEICRKLDGIPLAIELAAARVRGMTAEQIAGRLDERFRLLSGARRAQERHRTLQAAVSWSHDLLSPAEQRLFRRLSVFPASFDVAAAETVGGDSDVLDDLLHLVDRSLVQHDPSTGRYRLLETLRQYGAERAVDAGEADDIRERYIDHYAALVADIGPGFEDPQRFTVVTATLDAEIDNITAVAELLISDRRWRDLHDLCLDGATYLGHSEPALSLRWLDMAVEAGACADTQERIDALGWLARYAVTVGTGDLAARRAAESIALAASTGTAPSPWAHFTLAHLANYEGRSGDDYLAHIVDAMGAAERHTRLAQLVMRANWLDPFLRIHGYAGNDTVIDDVLRETSEHAAAYMVAVVCAASTAIWIDRDLSRGLRYLDTVTDPSAGGPVMAAWLNVLNAVALSDRDPQTGVGLATQAVRWSDRVASPFAMHYAVLTLAVLAVRVGRFDLAARLHAHTEAFPDYQSNPALDWTRADTLAALAAAGIPTRAPHELPRRELFMILADLEAS